MPPPHPQAHQHSLCDPKEILKENSIHDYVGSPYLISPSGTSQWVHAFPVRQQPQHQVIAMAVFSTHSTQGKQGQQTNTSQSDTQSTGTSGRGAFQQTPHTAKHKALRLHQRCSGNSVIRCPQSLNKSLLRPQRKTTNLTDKIGNTACPFFGFLQPIFLFCFQS